MCSTIPSPRTQGVIPPKAVCKLLDGLEYITSHARNIDYDLDLRRRLAFQQVGAAEYLVSGGLDCVCLFWGKGIEYRDALQASATTTSWNFGCFSVPSNCAGTVPCPPTLRLAR